MRPINQFLLSNGFMLSTNPCISPDFCLDWPALSQALQRGDTLRVHEASRFQTAHGDWVIVEQPANGDRAWKLTPRAGANALSVLKEGIQLKDGAAFPATFENLLLLKNHVQEADPGSTIFPRADERVARSTLGIGARFTTLHWPAVEWAMAALGIGVTANQNSIPRELVFDVDVMLANKLEKVPFPFIGTEVPEGHQGQSVEGMSHGAILSKLETGFHRRRIAWNFNADHQPIGGKFDKREQQLVEGCVLANYITFDLSPELSQNAPAGLIEVDGRVVEKVKQRLDKLGLSQSGAEFEKLLLKVWPALKKMQRRDELYRKRREALFTTQVGRSYIRELSIDELPGRTTPETTAIMLALCEELGMPISFVAPAFGFQKNLPFPDNAELRKLIQAQWDVCRAFNASIGFHSGSGKSAENYRVMGEITGSRLEIKTSGRYTYEMGRALAASSDKEDHALWLDWYRFTLDLALAGAFSDQQTERDMARSFISATVGTGVKPEKLFESIESCRAALKALTPSPDHVVFFEYNFLYVLAAGGRAEKSALGDHGPEGYRQRARFYRISDEARLRYAKAVAGYIVFLAETTGLADAARARQANDKLEKSSSYRDFIAQIGNVSN
ncbi:MAG TPA: tagaturonate epimerase family protein [Opitutaceae bacterium]|nr:tagaturonate epimerase family protein [Opitutaceae bacterium]